MLRYSILCASVVVTLTICIFVHDFIQGARRGHSMGKVRGPISLTDLGIEVKDGGIIQHDPVIVSFFRVAASIVRDALAFASFLLWIFS